MNEEEKALFVKIIEKAAVTAVDEFHQQQMESNANAKGRVALDWPSRIRMLEVLDQLWSDMNSVRERMGVQITQTCMALREAVHEMEGMEAFCKGLDTLHNPNGTMCKASGWWLAGWHRAELAFSHQKSHKYRLGDQPKKERKTRVKKVKVAPRSKRR